MNPEKFMPRHMIMKLLNTKKSLESSERETTITYRETPIQITAGFSFETTEIRRM